jgi:hypothetical protein
VIENNIFQNMYLVLVGTNEEGGWAIAADALVPATSNNFLIQVGGSGTSQGNTITNCIEGVDVTEYANINITYNTFQDYPSPWLHVNFNYINNGNYGINFITGASKQVNISNNNVLGNYSIGINAYRTGTNNSTGDYNINYNTINITGGGGIQIGDLTPSSTSNNLYVDYNTITVDGNAINIFGVKASAAIEYNTINLTHAPVGPFPAYKYGFGIGLYGTDMGPGGNYTTVLSNTINGNITSPDSSWINLVGIHAQGSIHNSITCNTITNIGRCFQFDNACSPSSVLNNTMTTAYDGIVLNGSGVIGQQGTAGKGGFFPSGSASGNIWSVPAGFINSETLSISSNGSLSTFYVQNSARFDPTNNKYIPTGSAILFNNSANIPISSCVVTIPFPTVSLPGSVQSAMAPSPALASTASLDRQISPSSANYPVYTDESMYYDIQSAFEYLQNNPSIQTGKYKFFSDSLSEKSIGLFYKVNAAIQQNNPSLAGQINSSVSPSNTIEQNQQTINSYLINGLSDGHYKLAHSNVKALLSIASQCYLTGGKSVYQARGLYKMLLGHDTTFIDICVNSIQEAKMSQNQGNYNVNSGSGSSSISSPTGVRLYPNPNGGSFTLEYNIDNSSDAFMEIFDVTGKRVDAFVLNPKSNLVQINESSLVNGLYYYRISCGETIISSNKLVIIK